MYNDNVQVSTSALYPRTMSALRNKWTIHKQTEFVGIGQLAHCEAIAALYHSVPIDFYQYEDEVCTLGDFSKTGSASGDATVDSIQIRTCKHSSYYSYYIILMVKGKFHVLSKHVDVGHGRMAKKSFFALQLLEKTRLCRGYNAFWSRKRHVRLILSDFTHSL